MKISVDGQQIHELTPIQLSVIEHELPTETCNADLCNRVKYILDHKYEQCLKRLKEEWIPKLKANGVTSIPLDDDAFSALVFSQPNYKNRSQRDSEIVQI